MNTLKVLNVTEIDYSFSSSNCILGKCDTDGGGGSCSNHCGNCGGGKCA